MHTYEAKTFNIPTLADISDTSVKEHLGLYEGYVKNFNAMTELISELANDSEKNAHALAEIVRRRSFEFGGMRLHEHYFAQWEGSAQEMRDDSALAELLTQQFGSVDAAVAQVRNTGMMRGPGWSILYWDPQGSTFHIGFTGEQHQGHFVTLPIVLGLDVWEHSYVLDHGAAGKGAYIDAFFKNLNWGVIEKRFEEIRG